MWRLSWRMADRESEIWRIVLHAERLGNGPGEVI
jgi:hypothetical protein